MHHLDNKWVSRAGNVSFLAGVLLLIWRFVGGRNPFLIAAVLFLAVGVVLIGSPHLYGWFRSREGFVDVVITVGGQGMSATQYGRVYSMLNVRVYNRDSTQPAALSFFVSERFKAPDEFGPLIIPLEPTDPPNEVNERLTQFGQKPVMWTPLSSPINVPPRTAVRGDFHFLRSPLNNRWGEPEGFVLRIEDHHSQKVAEYDHLSGEFTPREQT